MFFLDYCISSKKKNHILVQTSDCNRSAKSSFEVLESWNSQYKHGTLRDTVPLYSWLSRRRRDITDTENEIIVCINKTATTRSHSQASELGENIPHFCFLEDSFFSSCIQMDKYHGIYFFQESYYFSLGKSKHRIYFLLKLCNVCIG